MNNIVLVLCTNYVFIYICTAQRKMSTTFSSSENQFGLNGPRTEPRHPRKKPEDGLAASSHLPTGGQWSTAPPQNFLRGWTADFFAEFRKYGQKYGEF
jgi:hypothetical protein